MIHRLNHFYEDTEGFEDIDRRFFNLKNHADTAESLTPLSQTLRCH